MNLEDASLEKVFLFCYESSNLLFRFPHQNLARGGLQLKSLPHITGSATGGHWAKTSSLTDACQLAISCPHRGKKSMGDVASGLIVGHTS